MVSPALCSQTVLSKSMLSPRWGNPWSVLSAPFVPGIISLFPTNLFLGPHLFYLPLPAVPAATLNGVIPHHRDLLMGPTGFSAMPPRACQNSRKQSGKVSQWRPGALPDHSHDTDITTLSASHVTSEDPVRCAPPTVPYEKQGVFVLGLQ